MVVSSKCRLNYHHLMRLSFDSSLRALFGTEIRRRLLNYTR